MSVQFCCMFLFIDFHTNEQRKKHFSVLEIGSSTALKYDVCMCCAFKNVAVAM